MKFFLPVQETKIAEESYQALKKFIEKQTGWPISERRYYEIHYRQNDRNICARVGGPDPVVPENLIRADSRHEGESAHNSTSCLRSFICLAMFVGGLFKSRRRLEAENLEATVTSYRKAEKSTA